MKRKKEIYHKYIHKKLRRIILIYLLICLIMFSIVILDSFKHDLPFYYILFFVPGILLSLLFKKTQKIFWNQEEKKIIKKMDFVGITLIISIVLIKKTILPIVFSSINIIYITDAILIVTIGIFSGRIIFMWKEIKKIFSKKFLTKITTLDSKR